MWVCVPGKYPTSCLLLRPQFINKFDFNYSLLLMKWYAYFESCTKGLFTFISEIFKKDLLGMKFKLKHTEIKFFVSSYFLMKMNNGTFLRPF